MGARPVRSQNPIIHRPPVPRPQSWWLRTGKAPRRGPPGTRRGRPRSPAIHTCCIRWGDWDFPPPPRGPVHWVRRVETPPSVSSPTAVGPAMGASTWTKEVGAVLGAARAVGAGAGGVGTNLGVGVRDGAPEFDPSPARWTRVGCASEVGACPASFKASGPPGRTKAGLWGVEGGVGRCHRKRRFAGRKYCRAGLPKSPQVSSLQTVGVTTDEAFKIGFGWPLSQCRVLIWDPIRID